jgi:hypothetical protein
VLSEKQTSKHYYLALLAADAWLMVERDSGHTNAISIKQEIDALKADVKLLKAHQHDMKDQASINRATDSIVRIYTRIFNLQELLRSLRLVA